MSHRDYTSRARSERLLRVESGRCLGGSGSLLINTEDVIIAHWTGIEQIDDRGHPRDDEHFSALRRKTSI